MQKKKIKLYLKTVLLTTLFMSAVIGIISLFAGNFGDIQAKIVETTLSISVFSTVALTGAKHLEQKKGLAYATILASVVAALMFLVILWFGELMGLISAKIAEMLVVVALSLAHCSLLIPASDRKKPRFVGILMDTIIACIGIAALIWCLLIVGVSGVTYDLLRLLGAFYILIATGTVAVLVTSKSSSSDER